MRGWVRMYKSEANSAVGSTQYGIGCPGWCVSLRHDLLLDWMLSPDHAVLGIDLENMHNSVSTGRLEQQVANRIPRMAELLRWLRIPRTHVYRDTVGQVHSITSNDGLD